MIYEIINIDGNFIKDGKLAWREGERCANENGKIDDNPYEEGSYLSHQWRKGFAITNYHKS